MVPIQVDSCGSLMCRQNSLTFPHHFTTRASLTKVPPSNLKMQFTTIFFSVLALAASAIAAPQQLDANGNAMDMAWQAKRSLESRQEFG